MQRAILSFFCSNVSTYLFVYFSPYLTFAYLFCKHRGPTEKLQALHRSLHMADAAIGKRFLWSIARFCGVKFTLEAGILQVRDVYDG